MVIIMTKPKFKSFLNHTQEKISFLDSPSRTKQEFKRECDINNILKNWDESDVITHINKTTPQYLDLSESVDYHSSVSLVLAVNSAFAGLSSQARKAFDNNPSNFMAFAADPANRETMARLGVQLPQTASKPVQETAPKAGAPATTGAPDGVPPPSTT